MKINEKLKKVRTIQESTINDIISKLDEFGKCLCVRPTGFGKTHSALQVAERFKNVVYMYPTNNIKNDVKGSRNYDKLNVTFYSYLGIVHLFASSSRFKTVMSEFDNPDTLFILDEAHSLGAPKTEKAISYLMNVQCPNAKYLGLTATPKRTNGLEIKWHFFDGIEVEDYDMNQAIKDGVFEKPYYIYTPLDGKDLLERILAKIDKMDASPVYKKELTKEASKINLKKMTIENLPDIIKDNIFLVESEDGYYKFILFFSSFAEIHAKRNHIISSFKTVFPNHTVNDIIVSSESYQYKLNLESIHGLIRKPNTIDLILNVNMLTFGSHIKDISGIMMFRQTISDIIYQQQVGRCLSVMNSKSTIIFDFVENLWLKAPSSQSFDTRFGGTGESLGLALDTENIKLNTAGMDLLNIDRLINSFQTEEIEEEVALAYVNGLVDLDYCLTKLHLVNREDFDKIIERYLC